MQIYNRTSVVQVETISPNVVSVLVGKLKFPQLSLCLVLEFRSMIFLIIADINFACV